MVTNIIIILILSYIWLGNKWLEKVAPRGIEPLFPAWEARNIINWSHRAFHRFNYLVPHVKIIAPLFSWHKSDTSLTQVWHKFFLPPKSSNTFKNFKFNVLTGRYRRQRLESSTHHCGTPHSATPVREVEGGGRHVLPCLIVATDCEAGVKFDLAGHKRRNGSEG